MHYPPDTSDTITVDLATGAISTKGPLDYETRKTYAFLAMPLAGGDATRVRIDVLDENDNAPAFPTPARVTLALSEVAIEGKNVGELMTIYTRHLQAQNCHCRQQQTQTRKRIQYKATDSSQAMLITHFDSRRDDKHNDSTSVLLSMHRWTGNW